MNKVCFNKEMKNLYIPISNINNGNSYINSIFESQINKMLNKKVNVQNSINSIQQQSRQKQSKYVSNPSYDNLLKTKKVNTMETQKQKLINNNNDYNINKNNVKKNVKSNYNNYGINKKGLNREIMRNRSCKGVMNKNPLINDENFIDEKIFKKKRQKLKKNQVRRNISTDFLNKKNSLNNYNENTNSKNKSHIVGNQRNNIKENYSNNQIVRKIKQQLEDIIPPFEFEKIFRNRLLSANNEETKKKNNVNVKINIQECPFVLNIQ